MRSSSDVSAPLLLPVTSKDPSPKRSPSSCEWMKPYKYFITSSWWNILLAFVPLSFTAHLLGWNAALRFFYSFVAIIPLAKLLGLATDQMSLEYGQTFAGLMSASFGNAVELIIGIAGIRQGQIRIVQQSMLGSVLSNILLVMGCSFLAAGTKYSESMFEVTGAQVSASLMILSSISILISAAFHLSQLGPGFSNDIPDLLLISRFTAIVLLVVYVVYLVFQLKTHSHLFGSEGSSDEDEDSEMSASSAFICLIAVTVITAFCAEYLVASIEETTERYPIPKSFIGLILLPIVGNAAEHATAVLMALKNQMSTSVTICVGSSIQISTFVLPLMVLVGWCCGVDFTLHFSMLETIILIAVVFLVYTLLQDGKSNYMEGVILIALYLLISITFWVSK